jgi:pSer/pThr/pTyr-binding forkhead associated (FHA) protein
MADVPILVCTRGTLKGQRFRVPEGGLDVGRADENGLVVKDDGVSRFHARLLYNNGSLWLQDAGSRNGVFVNGRRVTGHQALKVGDEITIAESAFAVRWNESDEEDTGAREKPAEGSEEQRPARRRWFWPF